MKRSQFAGTATAVTSGHVAFQPTGRCRRFNDRKATTASNGGDSSHTATMLTRIADIGCNTMTPSYAGLRL